MGKNVAVFVDVANIFYAAKAAGADIDYVLLLKAATAGRDLVRAYAYTGLDPENENQRNFHAFLARSGFRVVSKDIRKYGDGKVKANLDIELVVDLLKTSRNLDVAVIVSGDGDFAPAIRAVQETGVRVEVISFRGNTSSDLMDVADKFSDITQLAKVDKGSTASRRRVAADEEDLSMTEVPDKESEGSSRGRGRGRTRGRPAGAPATQPVAARAGSGLVALPGEKLSKGGGIRRASAAAAEAEAGEEPEEAAAPLEPGETETEAEGRRRRRRRGGRGRGRGRGQEAGAPEGAPMVDELPEDEEDEADEEDEEAEEAEVVAEPTRSVVRPAAFGSIWDSQIGVPSAPRPAYPLDDEELDDEPAIPEYLLAERRRGSRSPQGRRGRQHGRGGAYAAAVDRERYGGRGVSRPAEPAGRGGQQGSRGDQRSQRPAQPAQARDRGPDRRPSAEPWSEVPPELEEMLRAQIAHKLARQEAPAPAAPEPAAEPADKDAEPAAAAPGAPEPTAEPAAPAPAPAPDAPEPAAPAPAPAPRRRTRQPAAPEPTGEVAAPAPRRRTRQPAAAAEPTAPAPAPGAPEPTAEES